ncbi:glycoside hydrolase family 26 protein [Roseibium sp. Sym1]|uniref:glycoside hydrolase family 26 protein n=1 Tax=Roseibium sp. Sym1 TaxID=3016006 RepID=UPI0022B45EB1|nr:glycosyl hydrolase family 5 [Roseibium sp. Sym1]
MVSQHPRLSRRQLLVTGAAAAATAGMGVPAARAQTVVEGRDLRKDKRPVLYPDGPKFGCYDPYGDFTDDRRVATEHLFLPWEDVDLAGLPEADAYALERNRKILVTIEPWSWALDWNVSQGQLRDLIISGQRDANLRAILSVLQGFQSPITIRWAQEMDNPFIRFPWSKWAPEDYIAAFRRVSAIVREMLPGAQMMWSPRGEKDLQDYYPGDEHLDLVGLTVLGLERYDEIEYGATRSFAESVQQGYELTVDYGKPIWVAELAYEGGLDYVRDWVMEADLNYPEYPELKEVVYFNDKEVWEWPYGLGLPDWRVIRDRPSYPNRR